MDIQNANLWKRGSAYLFDIMLLVMLAVFIATGLASLLDYDAKAVQLEECYNQVEQQYNIDFDITEEDFNALSQEDRDRFNQAYEALTTNEDTLYIYNSMIYLTLLMISLALLASFLVLEFAVPLLFKNGQTLGKKVFGVALMRPDGIKISPFALFVRAILGKYSIGTMVPVLLALMMFWGVVGIVAPVVILGLLILQIVLMVKSPNRCTIHDRLAGTVPVDLASQLIFDSQEAKDAYHEKWYSDSVH